MATCPVINLEVIFLNGVTFATVIYLCIKILTNPALHSLRGNLIVFSAITLSSLVYLVWAVLFCFVNPLYGSFAGSTPVALIFNAMNTYCHHTILLERVIPLLRNNQSFSSHTVHTIASVILPAILSIPAWLQLSSNATTVTGSIVFNLLFTILDKICLTAIFLRILLENRAKNTFFTVVLNNKEQWAQLTFCVVTWVVNLIVQLLMLVGNVIIPTLPLTIIFRCYFIAMILSFDSFLYITKSATKDILQSGFTVSSNQTATKAKTKPSQA